MSKGVWQPYQNDHRRAIRGALQLTNHLIQSNIQRESHLVGLGARETSPSIHCFILTLITHTWCVVDQHITGGLKQKVERQLHISGFCTLGRTIFAYHSLQTNREHDENF